MKCLGFREPTMALEPYEKPVIRNAIHCPPGRYTNMAIGMMTCMAATTNGLLPLVADQELLMPWLGINDIMLGAMLTAAVVTINTETAVPAMKEKLSKPGLVISDTRQESLDDWTGQCDRCATVVPIRSYHCAQCHKCVSTFDHHCSILGVCIGQANRRAFLATLVSALLYLINTLAISIAAICMVAGLDVDVAMNKVAWIACMVATAALTIGPISILLRVCYWQIRAAMLGITQYEWFSMRSAQRDEAKRVAEAKLSAESEEKAEEEETVVDIEVVMSEADLIVAYYAAPVDDVPEVVVEK